MPSASFIREFHDVDLVFDSAIFYLVGILSLQIDITDFGILDQSQQKNLLVVFLQVTNISLSYFQGGTSK